ncbi:YxeA family protein [Staphylococcus shinii]|jgi:uncharacterized protein (TIGR01655 family)|uniref:YxeA family protein n=2 Tax=Staphylococcus TaxID=1279 RepID=UPI000C34F938|nr:YxeA family protein [Staphylococcus shinii]MDW8569412.1 YxeA family protein [Staphylococcus shinii]MDW8572008.1 YxeA family protein [Staphylococcus shinii]PKI13623.1 hypothetical protein CW743_06045 [Staphylococcus shinii]
MKIIISVTVMLFLLLLLFFTNDKFDRFNPLLPEETSYAIVKLNTQNYDDVIAYSKDGEKLGYKLTFGGYDPNKQFVQIEHKGTYVKNIKYIEKYELPSNIR